MKVKANTKELRLSDVKSVESEDNTMIISGYACVFNQETLIGDEEWGFYETIDRNAFDTADFKDCCLKYNHNDTKGILARTRNGSLRCGIDDVGLRIEATLIDTQDNIDIYKCIKAGLLDKMSFAFTVDKEGDKWEEVGNFLKRTITKIAKVWDCAVVDIPAYEGTSIYARSKEIAGEQLKLLKSSLDNDERALDNALQLEKEKAIAKFKGGL